MIFWLIDWLIDWLIGKKKSVEIGKQEKPSAEYKTIYKNTFFPQWQKLFRTVEWMSVNDQTAGRYCDEDVDECSMSPCRNGATCKNIAGSYQCLCVHGYTGNNCQDNPDDCASGRRLLDQWTSSSPLPCPRVVKAIIPQPYSRGHKVMLRSFHPFVRLSVCLSHFLILSSLLNGNVLRSEDVYVCSSVSISQKPDVQASPNFHRMLLVVAARSLLRFIVYIHVCG